MNTFSIRDTTISFRNKDEQNVNGWFRYRFKHYGVQHRMFNMLRTKGFEIRHDDSVNKVIRRNYFIGRKGELRFKSHRYPNGFEITFFQEINIKNPNGGFYDFDKFKKMPYLIKKQFILICAIISEFLENFAENKTISEYRSAKDQIKFNYVNSCHHPQKDMNFNLSDLNGTTCEHSYNNADRDGKTIFNGDFKYFRDYNGYLACGTVYHNINNMWWVIVNDNDIKNIADFELFDISDSDYRKRVKKGKPPQKFTEKMEVLSQCSVKELRRELKRRMSDEL